MFRRASFHRSEPGETSALETDVVRFVAIMGLTLMVIFALVHSLPYEGSETRPQVELRRQQEADPEDLVSITRDDLDRLQRQQIELDRTAERLARETAARDELNRELEAQRRRFRRATAELEAERNRVGELEAELDEAAREVAIEEPAPDVPEPQTPQTVEPVAEPPRVLVLRFQDDQVYLDLLGRHRIQSYLRVSELDLTYRVLRESRDELAFSLVYRIGDEALYEIPDGMVPAILRDETRRFDMRLSLRNDLDYLVVLSDRIRAQVARLESAGKVGYYDILASEQVVPVDAP